MGMLTTYMSSGPPFYPPPPPSQPPEDPPRREPFQDYFTPQPPPRQASSRSSSGMLGGLAAGAAVLFKFGVFKTLLTLLLSFGLYWAVIGPWAAAGLVLMILVHEMGHVIEIRRQGMAASAPLFIPFFGAAIFQRQHPTDALKQAQIGIAGPLAGTVGATAAFVLYGSTHFVPLLLAAYLGFFINLFNLIPVGMLDGGWIMAVVSKWFQVFGVVVLVVAALYIGIPWYFLILCACWMGPAIVDRFRNDRSPYYQVVPIPARLAMGAAWVALSAFLGFA